jgi:hypothetical protein
LINQHVVLSLPKASPSSFKGRGEDPPSNGTEFPTATTKYGVGTIGIANEVDADALVQVWQPNGAQFRAIYVTRHMNASMKAVPPGLFLVTYSVGSGWNKGMFTSLAGYGKIGTFQFMEIESATGVKADHYQVRLMK